MNVALRRRWTQQEFFTWAEAQRGRHEFVGFEPVAMTGGSANHSSITVNILTSLRSRLRGTRCRPFGPDAGLETIPGSVRYPDALVTCSAVDGTTRTIPGAVVVFEVVSPSSARIDHFVKLREYAAVPSIRRYAMAESSGIGLLVLSRGTADEPWTATALAEGEVLALPEIGIELPVDQVYEDVRFEPEPGR